MEGKKKILAGVVSAGMILSSMPASFAAKGKITSIQVTNLPAKTVTLKTGKTKQLKVKVKGTKKVSKAVVYKTSNKKVVTVTKGKLKALKKGKAKVTVSAKANLKKKVVVNVIVGTPVTKIKLNKSKLTLKKGKTVTLKATVLPKTASNKKVIWSTSNKKVVSVKNGKVKALKAGSAKVKALSADGSGKSATAKITVKAAKKKAPVKSTASKTKPAPAKPATPTPATQTTPAQPSEPAKPAETPKKAEDVKASSIKINEGDLILQKNEKKALTVTFDPANTTDQKIEWSSNDASVVTVDENGIIYCAKRGEAKITATNKASGATSTITVKVTNKVVAHNQSELEGYLKDDLDDLTIDSSDNLTIPEDTYSTDLIVKGSGNITNNGTFNTITVAGTGTFTENKKNNLIVTNPTKVVVAKDAQVDNIKVSLSDPGADKNVDIENDGQLNAIDIITATNVTVSGDSKQSSVMNVNISAANVKFTTNQQAFVSLTAKATLVFNGPTDKSEITIDKESSTPDVYGSGTFTLTNLETNKKTVIYAQPLETGNVVVNGSIKAATASTSQASEAESTLKNAKKKLKKDGNTSEGLGGIVVVFKNVLNPDATYRTTTNDDGSYSITVPIGNYVLTTEGSDAYKSATQYVSATPSADGQYQNEEIALIPANLEDHNSASVSGTVVNAHDGNPVKGITVELRKGLNNISEDAIATTTTDEDGKYKFENLEGNQYTVRVIDTNKDQAFISASRSCTVLPDQSVTQDVTSSPILNSDSGEFRFVLNWGTEEDGAARDLDSHLYGPSVNSTKAYQSTAYYEKAYYDENKVYSFLDHDDITWEGPETTTVKEPQEGKYTFSVYNFSYSDGGTDTIANSKASVSVYKGDALIMTVFAPKNGDGRWWNVCTFDTSKVGQAAVTTVNRIGDKAVLDGQEIDDDSENNLVAYGFNSKYFASLPDGFEYDYDSLSEGKLNPTVRTSSSWDEFKQNEISTKEGYTATYEGTQDAPYILVKDSNGNEVEKVPFTFEKYTDYDDSDDNGNYDSGDEYNYNDTDDDYNYNDSGDEYEEGDAYLNSFSPLSGSRDYLYIYTSQNLNDFVDNTTFDTKDGYTAKAEITSDGETYVVVKDSDGNVVERLPFSYTYYVDS